MVVERLICFDRRDERNAGMGEKPDPARPSDDRNPTAGTDEGSV